MNTLSETRHLRMILLLVALCCLQVAHGASCVIGAMVREASLQPGGQTTGTITLANLGATPQDVKVYLTDYQRYANGSCTYDARGTQARSNAGWVVITPSQLTVPAKGTASVFYSIQVPQDPKLVGTYWSMLMVENVNIAPPGPANANKPTLTVTTGLRYGIQLVTNIGNTGTCMIKFADRSIVEVGEKRFLQVDVENIGERLLAPQLYAEIYDGQGNRVGRVDGNRARIYPGGSGQFRIDITSISNGNYSALLIADNGDDHIFGKQITLELK
ncbi:MAG: COG1470 family protein [Armatimonadota bacterium]